MLKAAILAFLGALFIICAVRSEALAQGSNEEIEREFTRATRMHESGDLEGAIAVYRDILARRPDRADVRSNLGAAYARLGRYEDAISEYKRALALLPQNQVIRYNLALAYYKAAFFTEAAGELSDLIAAVHETRPERWTAILLLADCQIRLGEYKKVIDLLTPYEAARGNDRAFAYLLGSALISDNQVQRGQVLIDRVFGGEDSAEARLLIGSILLLADDGPGAVKEFERALELNPKLHSLHAWYGRALMRTGDSEKAMTVFRRELEINPNDFEANLYLGILLKREKQHDEALAFLQRARQVRPLDSYARYHLGALHLAMGKAKEALPLLLEVVREHPDFIEAHVVLASTYYRLDRKEDGDRERAIVKKLEAEQQAKPPGEQTGNVLRGGPPDTESPDKRKP